MTFKKIKRPLLERLHKWLFGFDAEIQIYGWAWFYWCQLGETSPEGDYIAVTDGWLCFQRRYAV